jgi:signal transduction histidine kinase
MSLVTPFRPLFQGDTYRALLFLALAAPVGAAALAVLIGGWTAAAVLAITPAIVPVLVAFRVAVGLLARGDAALAEVLLGVTTGPGITSGGRGFWGRGKSVLADGGFWKQQAYLALRMTIGFGFAVAELSLLVAALGAFAYPAWYRWSDLHFGSWRLDTLGHSLVLVPAGLVGLVAAAHLARALGALSAWLAGILLGRDTTAGLSPEATRRVRRRALAVHAGVAASLVGILILVWSLTGHGYFWPQWVLLPLALTLAVHGWVELLEERPQLGRGLVPTRGLAIHLGISVSLVVFLIMVWAVSGHGYFWPEWPLLAAGILLGAHAVVAHSRSRSRLARRVGVLETTRAGAVDAQEAELRRIERDLHDGAQARLVALGMSLGLAEQKLESDPETARQLVTEAQAGVGEALRELRDLARGIHPPVLSDRGLGAALETLAHQSALPVTVSVRLDERLAPAVETAAYFVAAEALANAAKHSGASRIEVGVARDGDKLEIEIADDGRGGADPSGSGLTGLRRRVEALDGTFAVTSPVGGPTTLRVELPCGS